jgi:hypothetical protein
MSIVLLLSDAIHGGIQGVIFSQSWSLKYGFSKVRLLAMMFKNQWILWSCPVGLAHLLL